MLPLQWWLCSPARRMLPTWIPFQPSILATTLTRTTSKLVKGYWLLNHYTVCNVRVHNYNSKIILFIYGLHGVNFLISMPWRTYKCAYAWRLLCNMCNCVSHVIVIFINCTQEANCRDKLYEHDNLIFIGTCHLNFCPYTTYTATTANHLPSFTLLIRHSSSHEVVQLLVRGLRI